MSVFPDKRSKVILPRPVSAIKTALEVTKNNGYFVKIKHNNIYTTQYLHMSKFAKGIKKGRFVDQGEVIGYVGSTGSVSYTHLTLPTNREV